MSKILAAIRSQFEEASAILAADDHVRTRYKAPNPALLVFNNSFVHREQIKETRKSDLYLCAAIAPGSPATVNLSSPSVLQDPTVRRSDLVIVNGPPATTPLLDAVKAQRARLGKLVLVLIGKLDKSVSAKVSVRHADFNELHYEPGMAQDYAVDVSSKTIRTRLLGDLSGLSSAVAKKTGTAADEALCAALSAAMDALEHEAVVKVRSAVTSRKGLASSLLGELASNLKAQKTEYSAAVKRYAASQSADDYHDVLRIAYNFSTDALRVIHLLVCVADLKPVVLWGTIAAHLKVSRAFEALPWLATGKKPSLTAYRDIIGGARNRAFHNFFAFNRTLDVEVDGVSLKATHLKLFRPFKSGLGGKDATDAFRYEDQDLVNVLVGFTRAPERLVELDFLRANERVITETEGLATATAEALFLLRR